MQRRPDSSLRGCIVGALLLTLSACGGESFPGGAPPPDDPHVPEALTERSRIAFPPEEGANRVLRGWHPWRHGERIALGASQDGAWLQLVHLAPRERELVLDLVDAPARNGRGEERGGRVRANAAGRDLGTFPFTDPLEIPLPADLPLGRILIELTPVGSPPPPLDVLAIAVRPVLPAGSAEQEVDELPWSPEFDSKPTGGIREATIAVPPAPKVVLLYVMDALRADFVGHLGGPEGISPTWDRLAREGVTLTRHRCVAPSTLPSTRALFSGHAFRFAKEYPLIDRMPLLAERFREAGYRTGLFSGNAYVSPSYGLDRGFDHVADEVLFGPDSPSVERGVNVNAARVQEAALAWLDSLELEKGTDNGSEDRAFLYLHTIHPHNPYAPPPELEARFTAGIPSSIDGRTDTLFAVQDGEREVDASDQERLRGLYAAAFAYNDRVLAQLVGALEERFEPGEVLVVLTSDHGEELFEHDGVLHGYTFYEEMLRIPLTFWWPGRIPPGRVDHPTDTLDLHATLLQLLGIDGGDDPDRGRDLRFPEGRTLWPQILRETTELPPRLHFAAAPAVRNGLVAATLDEGGVSVAKLVLAGRTDLHWGMGKGIGRSRDPEYFFDLQADPGEQHNRAGTGGRLELWLRSRLRAWVRAGEALGQTAGPAEERELDAETRERLRSLGYLQ